MMTPQQFLNSYPSAIQHPDVSVPVTFMPHGDPAKLGEVIPIADRYEDGHVILFKDAQLAMTEKEWGLLNSLTIPAQTDNFVKKAKLKHLFQPLAVKTFGDHVLSRMAADFAQAQKLQGLMQRVTEQVRNYVKAWFPNYKVLDDMGITWRLTPTDSEAMHYDSYGTTPNDNHNVRVFINLDDKPRLWGVSHDILTTIDRYRDLLRPRASDHPNLFNAWVNSQLPWREVARTFVSFAPLNMWLVNSQRVAHEIIYGRRMLAATIACDPASMNDPSKHFVNLVRKAWE